ncbi:hypothetical protein TNCV_1359731 [Trichonephila clavipes]|nr:hypothetical protein TNCV_1359731 [Trichonephila clavipes]
MSINNESENTSLLFLSEWFRGTTLVRPVSTSHHYRIWESGSVAVWSPVLRVREYPYTIFFEPNFGVHVPRSFGKTVVAFTSHLDVTWDEVVA